MSLDNLPPIMILIIALSGSLLPATAGVAELLGGWSPDKVLAAAREGFVYVSAEKLLQKDMAANKPNISPRREQQQGQHN